MDELTGKTGKQELDARCASMAKQTLQNKGKDDRFYKEMEKKTIERQ